MQGPDKGEAALKDAETTWRALATLIGALVENGTLDITIARQIASDSKSAVHPGWPAFLHGMLNRIEQRRRESGS